MSRSRKHPWAGRKAPPPSVERPWGRLLALDVHPCHRSTRKLARKHSGRRSRLLCQSPQRPLGPPASLTHHDFSRPGAGPPGPLPALLGPPAGAGGPTTGRCGPSEAPEAPLRSPLTPPPATQRSQRYVRSSVLSRPRAQHRAFIVPRRPRPSRHVWTAYVNAHVDWRSTRFSLLFSEE